jgi:hypothetical protein
MGYARDGISDAHANEPLTNNTDPVNLATRLRLAGRHFVDIGVQFQCAAEELDNGLALYQVVRSVVDMAPDRRVRDAFRYTEVAGSGLDAMLTRVEQLEGDLSRLGTASMSTVSVWSAAVSTAGAYAQQVHLIQYPEPIRPLIPTTAEINAFAQKLAEYSSDLPRIYREVWRSYYTAKYDPGRPGIGEMRDVWDAVLDALAPKDAVRIWLQCSHIPEKGKCGPSRGQYLEYVASVKVTSGAVRESLAKQIGASIRAYKALQELHTHSIVDEDTCRGSLSITDALLREWVDAAS